MPVDTAAIREATLKLFAPAYVIYLIIILIILVIYSDFKYATIIIYIITFLFGSIIILINEEKLFPKLMEIEKDAYARYHLRKVMDNKEKLDSKVYLNLENISPNYPHTQYDYYIKKTLLSQRLGSIYLICLMGGILLDITLNSVGNEDLFRTTLLMFIISIFSTLFLMVTLLKHAEYNAGCAIYRNAILGLNLCLRKFKDKRDISKRMLVKEVSSVLQNLRLRCKEELTEEKKEEFWIDGLRTIELLGLLGFIESEKEEKDDNVS